MPLDLQGWMGRAETRRELVSREPARRLAALLDREDESAGRHLPPLAHWLHFLPEAPQREIGVDGHPNRGGIYPPVELPMRMWAGSRITFHAPIPFDAVADRRSTILGIREKSGRTGPLIFLTLGHDIMSGGALCVSEESDIVFRDRSGDGAASTPGEIRNARVSRSVDPTAALLFRFSALTYNAHRIHYDRDYAAGVEGYPGLVVHGPLLATLLMDHFRRHRPGAGIKGFTFRAQRPVFDTAPFTVNLEETPDGADLWAAAPDGQVAVSARVEAA